MPLPEPLPRLEPTMTPWPIRRLAFREMTLVDLDDMATLLGDPEVMRFLR
jgi:hypothetical protein